MKLNNPLNKRIVTQSIRALTGNRMVTELRLVRTDRKGDMLNDYNLQECFNFNPDTGNYTVTEVTLNISLSPNEVYIKQANGSTKTAVDLGYSMDGSADEMVFQINGGLPSKIHFVAQRTDLVPISLGKTEVAIVTNDPNFRTCVFVNSEQVIEGATLSAKIMTRNTSISAWMLDIIAKKLNALDPEEIGDLEKLSTTSKNNLVNAINETNSNIGELPKLATTEKSNTVEAINEVNKKVNGITTGGETNTINIETNRTDIEVVTTRVTTAETDITALDDTTGDQRSDIDNNITAIETLNSSIQDGTLVDKEGFKYERVKRGKPKNTILGYSNVEVLIYPNDDCVITGNYDIPANQLLEVGVLSKPILNSYPCIVESVKRISLQDESIGGSTFLVSLAEIPSISYKVVFRNVSSTEADINGVTIGIRIECKKSNLDDLNII